MALVPTQGSSNSSFQQTGQLDWVALSRSTVSMTVGAVARYSKAGVDPFTICVGRALCHSMILQPAVQEEISKAILRLPKYPTYQSLMWLGFGLRTVPDELAETEQGLAFFALCASLSTTYDNLSTAKVLRHICITAKAPDELTPSLSQWRSVANLLANGLTSTKFPLTLSGLRRIISFTCNPGESGVFHAQSETEQLAEVILLLASVSSKKLFSITITGGFDCAWLAAFAECFLSLVVEIRNSESVLYRSNGALSKLPEAIFIVQPFSQESKPSNVVVIGKSYKLTSGEDSLIKNLSCRSAPSANFNVDSRHTFNTIVRSPWSSILHDTFNSDFEFFIRHSVEHFCTYLICVSLMTETISKERGVIRHRKYPMSLDPHNVFQRVWLHDGALGQLFLQYARNRLPELREFIKISHQISPDEAQAVGEESLDSIARSCRCNIHKVTQENLKAQNVICMRVLADVIILYLWLTLVTQVDDAILPSTNGLLTLYLWQEGLYETFRIRDQSGTTVGQYENRGGQNLANKDQAVANLTQHGIPTSRDGIKIRFSGNKHYFTEDWSSKERHFDEDWLLNFSTSFDCYPRKGLDLILTLFSGDSVLSSLNNETLHYRNDVAKCGSGVCVYQRFLENPSLPPAEIFQYKVVPGYITFEGSYSSRVLENRNHDSYPRILDKIPLNLSESLTVTPVVEMTHELNALLYSHYVTDPRWDQLYTLSFHKLFETLKEVGDALSPSRQPCNSHKSDDGQTHIQTVSCKLTGVRHKFTTTDYMSCSQLLSSKMSAAPGLWMVVLWNPKTWNPDASRSNRYWTYGLEILCDQILPLYVHIHSEHRGPCQLIRYTTCVTCVVERAVERANFDRGVASHLRSYELGRTTPDVVRSHFKNENPIEIPWEGERVALEEHSTS